MKKVTISICSNWTSVADFDYLSVVNSIEHCKVLISNDDQKVWLAYTFYNSSDIFYKYLGDFNYGNFASLLCMLKKATGFANFLSNRI